MKRPISDAQVQQALIASADVLARVLEEFGVIVLAFPRDDSDGVRCNYSIRGCDHDEVIEALTKLLAALRVRFASPEGRA